MNAPDNIRACVFDAYGTLFDFASAVTRCRDLPSDHTDALVALWRDKQLQYSWLRSLQGAYVNFWQVTYDALEFALDSLGIDDLSLQNELIGLYRMLDTFPEVPSVLKSLKARGFRTAILSNGTTEMLAATIDHAGIGSLVDDVFSVDEVGVYKTAPQAYQLALDRLGITAREVSFQSSNAWDVHAASAFGFQTIWCNRNGQRRERLPGRPDSEISNLTEMLDLVGRDAAPAPQPRKNRRRRL